MAVDAWIAERGADPEVARAGKYCRPHRRVGMLGSLALLAGILMHGVGARAEAPADSTPESSSEARRDPAALEAIQGMAGRLASAGGFSVKGEISWEALQPDGQLLEFGALRELVFQRPDRLRVDLTLREGGKRSLLYDGARVVLQDLDQNVYASVPRTGPADEVVAFVSDTLGLPVALAEFLSPDLPALLSQKVESATDVGVETIDGVLTRHVAMQNVVGAIEFWIGEEDSLPRRITIRYEYDPGQPRFQARFAEWNLTPEIAESTFAFEPAAGAEKIAFAARPKAQPQEEAR